MRGSSWNFPIKLTWSNYRWILTLSLYFFHFLFFLFNLIHFLVIMCACTYEDSTFTRFSILNSSPSFNAHPRCSSSNQIDQEQLTSNWNGKWKASYGYDGEEFHFYCHFLYSHVSLSFLLKSRYSMNMDDANA